MHALPPHTPQLTTDNVFHRTTEGTPTYRPSTRSPCHGRWDLSGTCPGRVWPPLYGLLELPSGSLYTHHCQSCGAATPFWGPNNGWC